MFLYSIHMRQPLTTADLRAIRERSDSPDVRALLWEIRRLRQILLRSDQLVRSMHLEVGGTSQVTIARLLRDELMADPFIQESRAERQEMLYPDGQKCGRFGPKMRSATSHTK